MRTAVRMPEVRIEAVDHSSYPRLSQVYRTRIPFGALQRDWEAPFPLPKALGNRKMRRRLLALSRKSNTSKR